MHWAITIMYWRQTCTRSHNKKFEIDPVLRFILTDIYRDTYRIVWHVSWYVSYRDTSVLFHP